MRHLRSILYALVLAPAIWVLAGVGFTHDLVSRGRDMFTAESVSGLLLLIFAGILYAIMAFSPISPAGPTLAGATFLGVTYWAWSAPESYAGVWPPDVVKTDFDLSRPGYGLAALLAVPLLCTALSARRWARYEPPVLPIIGEIGRFRGSAKVAGETVAAAETTVLRTAQPMPSRRPADPTVAIPTQRPAPLAAQTAAPLAAQTAAPVAAQTAAPVAAQDDKTQIFGTVGADPTVAIPSAAATTPARPAVAANVANPAPNSNNSGITTNSTIAPSTGKTASQPLATTPPDGDQTVAMVLPATAPVPAKPTPASTPVTAAAASAQVPADEEKTTALPAQEEKTTALPARPAPAAAKAAAAATQPASAAAKAAATPPTAKAEPAPADGDKATALPAQVTPADGDKTTALPAQATPADGDKTTVLPAQPNGAGEEARKPADDEETEVLSAAALVTPPAEEPEVAKLPAAAAES
ncbi:hypothetical protein BJY16_002540 [Actinoplanes octamycinicus]|uniref:Meckel syndrome type 1 protein n=1 Tax=Actinoplanes octamycinicus TaxID=135948 RepID=A0A7W7M6V2_9ACTN|nr:hypothetical protein [Actinoplanes octamycinicus]MBB4739081.1 hypothetical protein [Actinoplanes octamycinicus]GIE60213.1 hypothetical protein Aoc01nite_56150 [Actinoplanes octamycinicus]